MALSSKNIHGRSCLISTSDPEETEMEEQAAAEKSLTKEELQVEWTAPAPEFTANST